MATNITGIIKHQIKTSTEWTSENPILLEGELGLESNTRRIKMGNGTTAWNSMNYIDAGSVDSINSTQFLRSDTSDTMSGSLTITGDLYMTTPEQNIWFDTDSGQLSYIRAIDGQIEFGSDNNIYFMESDADVIAVTVSCNNRTVTASGGFIGPLTGNVTGNVTGSSGSCTGNSATATWADTVDVNTSTATGNYNIMWHSGDTVYGANGLLQIQPSTGALKVGSGTTQANVRIYKADNNVSDHLQFYNGTTRVGEIGCEDTTWLRINSETTKNIYTPRMIRADGGFQVDAAYVVDASGNITQGGKTATQYIEEAMINTAKSFGVAFSTSLPNPNLFINPIDGSTITF